MIDPYGRTLDNLRISVTERCNMRCTYCMPAEGFSPVPKHELLSYEELAEIASRLVCDFGVRTVRLTGGEPTIRRDLPDFVAMLAKLPIDDLAMTTNALLMDRLALPLKQAGLRRLNISLDSLDKDVFAAMSRGASLEKCVRGIEACRAAGFQGTKFNAVLMRGQNDSEINQLIRFAHAHGGEMRFIEAMPIGVLADSHEEVLVPAEAIREIVSREFKILPADRPAGAPAEPHNLECLRTGERMRFGIIASETEPFCADCRRLRLTATGQFVPCLFKEEGADLREWIRTLHESDEARSADFKSRVLDAITKKPITRMPQVTHTMHHIGG